MTEVQYNIAGVIESHPCEPLSVKAFTGKGIGYTKDVIGEYSTADITRRSAMPSPFIKNEWENNRGLGWTTIGTSGGRLFISMSSMRTPSHRKRRFRTNHPREHLYPLGWRFPGRFRVSVIKKLPEGRLPLQSARISKGCSVKCTPMCGSGPDRTVWEHLRFSDH